MRALRFTQTRRTKCLLLAALAAVLSAVVFFTPNEPRYGGKTVSQWVIQFDTLEPREIDEADDALRALGPKAVPTLLGLVQYRDPWLKRQFCSKLYGASRSSLEWLLENRRTKYYFATQYTWRWEAALALESLGPQARSALPELTKLAQSSDEDISKNAKYALKAISGTGPRGREERTND